MRAKAAWAALAGAALVPSAAGTEHFVVVRLCGSKLLDGGFNEMVFDALTTLVAEGEDMTFEFVDCMDEEKVLAVAEAGADHVFLMGYTPVAEVTPFAHKVPNVKFTAINDIPVNLAENPNLQAATFLEDEGAFTAGVLAAELTTSGTVGVVAGVPFPALRRLSTGFVRGALHACPTCQVLSQYVMDFTSPDLGAEVAEYMVGEMGADVIFGAAGVTGNGAIQQALTHPDALVIGVDTDQFIQLFGGMNATTGKPVHPAGDRVVSSMMKRLDNAVRKIALDHLAGNFNPSGVILLDLSNDGVALAPCHAACDRIPAAASRAVAAATDAVAAGLASANLDPVSGSLVLASLYPRDVPPNSWTGLAPAGEVPPPLSGAAVARSWLTWDETIYAFGGASAGENLKGSSELYSLSMDALSWRRHGPLLDGERPPARTGATLAALADSLALFGGQGASGGRLGDLWLFVPTTAFVRPRETFLEVVAAPGGDWPTARVGHATSTIAESTKMVVFGGSDSGNTLRSDLWLAEVVLDLTSSPPTATATWTKLCDPCAAPARRGAQLTSHGDVLYLSGGLSNAGSPLSDLWRIDVAGDVATWTAQPDMPLARGSHAAAVASVLAGGAEREDVIAVVGGKLPTGTGARARRSVDYFVLESATWLTVYSHEPEAGTCSCSCEADDDAVRLVNGGGIVPYLPRSGHALFAIGADASKLLVLGGQDTEEGSFLQRTELFHPSETVVVEDMQRSFAVQSISRSLACCNIVLGLAFCVWTLLKRKRAVVRASQANFLFMIALGGVISSSAILPLSMDDSGDELGLARTGEYVPGNVACRSALVLFTTGWMTSFSFLFVKMWRVSRIISNKSMTRVTITNMQLFIIAGSLLGVEWAIVAAYFFLSPLRMFRDPVAVDELGQVTRSALSCRSDLGSTFLIVLVCYHLCVLFYGAYLCFRARHIESTFSESKYVSVALVSTLQVMCIATPVLVIVADNPISSMFIQSGVIFLNDLSVLLLIFVPKVLADRQNLDWTELLNMTSKRSGAGLRSGGTVTNHAVPTELACASSRGAYTATSSGAPSTSDNLTRTTAVSPAPHASMPK